MKLHTLATFVSLGLYVSANSILFNPPGFPPLPNPGQAQQKSAPTGLNLNDIQGDILIGMRKPVELFFFFSIANATAFKKQLKANLQLITTTMQILSNTTASPSTLVNIAFSQTGLAALGLTGAANSLNDPTFAAGQVNDVKNLSDPGTANWVPQFVGTKIHGVVLLGSDKQANIDNKLASLKTKFGNSVKELYSLKGAMRPAPNKGHEHFGFLDGISNPIITGFQDPKPGQAVVPAGEILVGLPGDNVTRPAWAKDGSFLVFRQLKQLVPEFNKFLVDNPIVEPGLSKQQGSDLLGARMVGRWKSGAPIVLSPMFDDPRLGADENRNNNFTFAEPGQTQSNLTDQSKCPLSAHIRKTRPRADLGLPESASSFHHIVRAGIPYGPEVTAVETSSNKTTIERGLAFVAYQSNIANGFQFLQEFWANNQRFRQPGVGFDPIIGAAAGAARPVNGLDPTSPARSLTLTTGELVSLICPTHSSNNLNADFVVSRGGEYFFAPSLSALAKTLTV
ncbi:fungal peroxidase [Mycena leptocephala]|nr:fungal peroxidase [Mycena leptocephala]